MPERTLEERYRLAAAAFRTGASSAELRSRLGDGFGPALHLVTIALATDAATAARDLDRDRIRDLLASALPARLDGREPWAAAVPDVVEGFLAFVADQESLTTAWELRSAVDESRAAFSAALASPGRAPVAPVRYEPDRRPSAKIGRNDPCFCGSGRKYKHCCLKLAP
jgi:hypothetical protein